MQRALVETRRRPRVSSTALDSDYRSPRPIPDEVDLELGGFREWLAVVGPMTLLPREGLAAPSVHRSFSRR